MFQIKIEHNLDELIADIRILEQKLADLSEFWQTFALPSLIAEVDQVFATEGYGVWDELNPIYEARKAIAYPGQPIMRLKDTLYESYTVENAPYSVQEIEPHSLMYGTDVPYAYFHEYGITPPENWGELPQRSVIGEMSPAIEDDLFHGLENYIDQLILDFDQGVIV